MKNILIAIIAVLIVAAISIAGGIMETSQNGGYPIQGFAPRTFGVYSSTKATINVPVSTLLAVKFRPTANITYGFDNSAVFPVDANSTELVVVPTYPGVGRPSNAVFYVTSSATTAKTKIYVQGQ